MTREECQDLEGCRATAESMRKGRPLIVETAGLEHYDEETEELLERLRASGAAIVENAEHRGRPGPLWRRLGSVLVRQWNPR
jgi:Ribonuclease G/E